ncbi:MAG: mevalonate 5-phosphate dehydratase small subunit [Methanothermococcus sp.]|nr:mevalonate 5-phosphate dehydratase small subunit [Methanothermococcus sp.]MDK2988328.1 mevalonate 5-phosphate dehydratase small subunit [Methanothermococcus sp.]
MEYIELNGRVISKGIVEGEAIVSKSPISFLGGVSEEGIITDKDNELYGQSIKDKILVFPNGKGSTVGSYVIYALAKKGILKGIVNKECEPIVATGAILGKIPLVDKVEIEKIENGNILIVDGNNGIVKIAKQTP